MSANAQLAITEAAMLLSCLLIAVPFRGVVAQTPFAASLHRQVRNETVDIGRLAQPDEIFVACKYQDTAAASTVIAVSSKNQAVTLQTWGNH